MAVRDDNQELGSGFARGAQFRFFKRLSLAAGASWTFKMVRTRDIIVNLLQVDTSDGWIQMDVYRDAVEGGTWSEIVPLYPRNDMTEVPQPAQVVTTQVLAGGTITGGVQRDTLTVKTSSATAQAATINLASQGQRGFAKGTTGYYKFSNPGAQVATCVIHMEWEEALE